MKSQEDFPACIVVDTNIWIENPLLKSSLGAVLLFRLRQIGGRLGLPEVIEIELRKNMLRRYMESVSHIEKGYELITAVMGEREEVHLPTEEEVQSAIAERLEALESVTIKVPFTLEHAKAALTRVNEGSPPNGPKNQQFKDSAIWESVLELARSYSVHLVTKDTGFYKGHDTRQGLASELRDECEVQGSSLHLHDSLASVLLALKAISPPPFDYAGIARGLAENFSSQWVKWAENKEIQIGSLGKHEILPFVTENPDVLAVSFKLSFEAFDLSPDAATEVSPASLEVKGSGSYEIASNSVTEALVESVKYIRASGEEVPSKSQSIIQLSSVRKVVRHKIQQLID